MSRQSPGVAFLLAQIGAETATRFASAIQPLGLTSAQAGLLRLVQSGTDTSQQEIAARLRVSPSRVVSILDDLEHRGIVSRRPGTDRRINLVTLTEAGHALLVALSAAARAHDALVTATLTARQREQLHASLSAIAEDLELTPGVHPGYGNPGPDGPRTPVANK